MLCLLVTKREAVSAEAKLDWVTEGRPANHFDVRAVAEAHLQQPPAHIAIPADGDHATAAPDAELVETAGVGIATMVARGEVTGLLHGG